MTTRVAPWLEGLNEAWEVPHNQTAVSNVSSASHNAGSLRNSSSRIPRRSLSGLPSSLSSQRTTSQPSTQKRRNPLAPLSGNDVNTLRRQNGPTKLSGSRSVSEASEGSLLACGTVQQRSKSASPGKKQETLEWKRRIVRGEVGYGDQTDLFGPSGLENIFSRSKGAENEVPTAKSRMSWLQKSDAPLPSSPPPWPSDYALQGQPTREQDGEELNSVVKEQQPGWQMDGSSSSFSSNPFDLQNSEVSQTQHQDINAVSAHRSSPDKAFIEPTVEETAPNRTVSGQTELEQEDFSPVFISKHTTITGQVDYAALDSHVVKQFQSTKINLRHPSHTQSHQDSSKQDDGNMEQSSFTDGPQSDSLPAAGVDLSFSENLPTGSPFPDLGRHIEFKRGGYSHYGSFKQRPLSPSQSMVESSANQDASGLPLDVQQRPPAPTPPKPLSTPVQSEGPKSRSSGSPLKLFGDHDTFTNNRLLRRLSQLNSDGTIAVRKSPTGSDGLENPDKRKVSRCSSFGNGELNEHDFDAEITITSASDPGKDDRDHSPGSEILAPGSKTPLGFRFEASPEVGDTFKLKRKLSKHSTATSKASTIELQAKTALHATVEDASESQLHVAPAAEARAVAEGKRPPTSPFKNPTPKRRRTLHASELENQMRDVNQSYHSQLQEAISSRKRKDARRGESQNIADPDILAQRKILRPRNPTPSQRRRQQIEAELREAAEEFAEQEPEKLEAVMEQIESSMNSDTPQTLKQQAHTLASEVAAFTLNVHKPSGEQCDRKPSVTTQDFLDEAMMVMNLIRAKARPHSNLGSVEESDAEAFGQSLRADGSHQAESLLTVSRPPSREGSGWRQHPPLQADARVMSHLRRFQEGEERDDTDFIANSIASLDMADQQHVNDQVIVVDENSNIRITGPLSDDGKNDEESDCVPESQRSQDSAQNTRSTQSSDGNSTGRTIDTSSTRKSDNVGTLAPDAVAHLIGNQVGGMTFDKDKKCWVRVSKSTQKAHGSFLELPSNVTSDDDPFREISDLPVDEQKEMRCISSPEKMPPNTGTTGTQVMDQTMEYDGQESLVEARTSSQETVISRPVTRDSSHIRHTHSSSVPSHYTALASSQQDKVETRATSWSDEELAKLSALGIAGQQPLVHVVAQAASDELTMRAADTQAMVDQGGASMASLLNRQLPSGTATIDHGQHAQNGGDESDTDELAGLRDDTALDLAESDVEDIASPKLRQTPYKPVFPLSSTHRAATRQMSLRRKTLTSRFNVEAHEQSELSLIAPLPGDRMMSLSLSVSKPFSTRQHARQVTDLHSSPSKSNSSFILSELPDFTVHEVDEERPSERALATRLAHHAAAEVNDRYALAVKELVRTLTDVNEDEPYWEDLKQLDLHDRSLASLHGLNDFCTRIQDMDVSNNVLRHLNGAPQTIRRLTARSNQLSALTSWSHLTNLQYLDISNNHLENLSGLGSLIHLRELCADDNDITTIDGVFELDGLLKIRLRRNKLSHVDFESSYFHRLTSLDLCGNRIASIGHLNSLSSLTELKLDGNKLTHGLRVKQPMLGLTLLSMRDCDLKYLDISNFPNLTYLYVDENRLANIEGISKLKNLVVLSVKRQTLPEGETVRILDQALEAQTVLLSGNTISSLHFSNAFMNIRHLEMASVGLQELPDDFGLRMPNLRTLNLNFNSLKDIRPLLNIYRLERLSVCSNRLHRLRRSVATFAQMSSLQSLDLRDNPLTQGFYANIASMMSRNTSVVLKVRSETSEDEDQHAAALEICKYELPFADAEQDRQHYGRLDEDTKLRRRVHEMLLGNSCRNLCGLDGLKFDSAKPNMKDLIWNRLVELGIIRKSQCMIDELDR